MTEQYSTPYVSKTDAEIAQDFMDTLTKLKTLSRNMQDRGLTIQYGSLDLYNRYFISIEDIKVDKITKTITKSETFYENTSTGLRDKR